MGEQNYKPPRFSTVQIAFAWFIGLALGSGALGLVGSGAWRAALAIPCVFGGIVTSVSVLTFIVTHWSDHE